MDGNPDVHAKTIRETLARQQQAIVNAYFKDCQELAQRLSQSASRVAPSPEFVKRLEHYMTLLPGARAITPARHDRMPYRFLAQVGGGCAGPSTAAPTVTSWRASSATMWRSSPEPQGQQGHQRRAVLRRAPAAAHRHLRLSPGNARCAPAGERAARGHRAGLCR
jgi:hypothetical protein